jgi:hypothetical protein
MESGRNIKLPNCRSMYRSHSSVINDSIKRAHTILAREMQLPDWHIFLLGERDSTHQFQQLTPSQVKFLRNSSPKRKF